MIILRVGMGEGKSALINAVGGSVNWYNLSGRHFGNMYEKKKTLRRHIPFDPVILCIKIFIQREKLIHYTCTCM